MDERLKFLLQLKSRHDRHAHVKNQAPGALKRVFGKKFSCACIRDDFPAQRLDEHFLRCGKFFVVVNDADQNSCITHKPLNPFECDGKTHAARPQLLNQNVCRVSVGDASHDGQS